MTNNLKHCQFQLSVGECGVEAWAANPESLATFLLMIAEAIGNGFWTDASQTTA